MTTAKYRRRFAASCAVILLAAVLLYFSLRGIDWRIVAATIASIRWSYASLALVIGTVPMFVRAARWRILLQAQAAVSFRTVFWAVAAGYFGNNFLPARGGEFVRSYIVRTYSELSVSYVLATALSERVADAVSLVMLSSMALVFVPQAPAWIQSSREPFAVIALCGLSGLICLPLFANYIDGVLARLPRLQLVVSQILLGMRSLHDWRRMARFGVLTLVIWFLDAASTSTLAHSLGIKMPLALSVLLITALSLSSAAPSTPGYVGVYQFVAVTVLKPFGISSSAAIAFILVIQAASYVVTSALGLLAVTYYTPFNWQSFRRPLQPIHIQS